jgi:hypothetical protein
MLELRGKLRKFCHTLDVVKCVAHVPNKNIRTGSDQCLWVSGGPSVH